MVISPNHPLNTQQHPWAELQCRSNFSFLQGASHPEELVETAAQLGYHALALTDECSVAGLVRAWVKARSVGLQLIAGSQFTLDGHTFIILCPNKAAWSELCTLISHTRQRAAKGDYQLQWDDFTRFCRNGLILWKPPYGELLNDRYQHLLPFHQRQQLWVGITYTLEADDLHHAQHLRDQAHQLHIPCVGCSDVDYHHPERHSLHDVLTAIRHRTTIDQLGYRLRPNSEHHLRPTAQLHTLYDQALIDNNLVIAERCTFQLSELKYRYPIEGIPPNTTLIEYLSQLVHHGAHERWPNGTPPEIQQQLDHELTLIQSLNYEPYFLTVYEIVQFARSEQILYQGRGSAANSAVCYVLFITAVDPTKSNLLFERFISAERNEPPDIDIDFEHERREEVIQFIYRKYGRHHTALTATVITYRSRSAIRDVGKALGFDEHTVNHLTHKLNWHNKAHLFEERLSECGFDLVSPAIQTYIRLVSALLRFPRHLSQHVGGFVISESPLHQMVPIENTAMKGRSIIQWDKDDIEAVGMMKIDVLALGMLTAIRKCFQLVEHHNQRSLSLASIPADDAPTYRMLQQGDSIGVFQVESRAQMSMLPRLKPQCYYDLVVQVAIVRPGPIQGKMVHPYLKRRQGLEPVNYPSEAVKATLARTLGVPIFQEQVIKLAMVAADFSAGEADQLRRSMAAWNKTGSLGQYETQLRTGLKKNGYTDTFTDQLIQQIRGFGAYGFPESHAASFALLVYASAWLKCHHPAAFCCALLNSLPMGFYSVSQLIQDAQRHQVKVLPIDVLQSDWDHTLEDGAIRLGMRIIKGLGQASAHRIMDYRQHHALTSLAQLTHALSLSKDQLEALANADALKLLSGHRYQTHWALSGLQPALALSNEYHCPEPDLNLNTPDAWHTLHADYRSTALTLNTHPIALLKHQHPEFQRCITANQLHTQPQNKLVRLCGLVTGRQRPGTAKGTTFVTLEDERGNANVIVWQNVAERHLKTLLEAQVMMVMGTVERSEGVIHVVAGRLVDVSGLMGELSAGSRDFH